MRNLWIDSKNYVCLSFDIRDPTNFEEKRIFSRFLTDFSNLLSNCTHLINKFQLLYTTTTIAVQCCTPFLPHSVYLLRGARLGHDKRTLGCCWLLILLSADLGNETSSHTFKAQARNQGITSVPPHNRHEPITYDMGTQTGTTREGWKEGSRSFISKRKSDQWLNCGLHGENMLQLTKPVH